MKNYLIPKVLILTLIFSCLCVAPAQALIPPAKRLPAKQAATEPNQRQPSIGEVWNRTELYFGAGKPDGSMVTKREFMRFVDEEVTPRFPDGLTVLTGAGQFRNSTGVIVKERSRVLILLYPPQARDAHRKLEEIREAYKRAFQQESVLRVDSVARVSF